MASLVDRVRKPEYTGENRCIPCTAVNLAIAVVLASGAFVAGVRASGVAMGAAVGLAVFGVGAAAIYLRGYLVPYTPTITKRYFPDSVLRMFDKAPAETGSGLGAGGNASTENDPDVTTADDLDVERFLVEADLLTECEHREDLCLTDWFGERWREAAEAYEEPDARQAAIADLLGVEVDDLSIVDYGSAMAVTVGQTRAGQWESEAAFVADLAAADVLAEEVSRWDELGVEARGQVLNSLRLFLEWCPACGEPLALNQETVESCCRSFEVVAVSCQNCGARLFETEMDELQA